jgi:sulfatase modifying factor 1
VAFVDWRSVAEDLPPGTYHLPTEAQWEKAAGWDPVQQKLWKYAIQSDTIDSDRVNYYCSAWVGRTTDVGSYPYTTFYGCYDMSGNVWEWCSDWYQSGAYPTSDSNPTGPGSGTTRALRGGYWLTGEASSRVGNRGARAPTAWSHIIGFRCAMTLE